VLSNWGPDKGEILIDSSKNIYEDTHLGLYKNSKGFGVEILK
jgi:hypothetical protein